MDEITVIIPLHDPALSQASHLRRLLSSLKSQSEMPKEIILSANHPITYLDTLLDEIQLGVNTKYILNSSKGAAENLNFLSDCVKTSLTKIMFQDDFFADDRALEVMKRKMQEDQTRWVATACNHYYEDAKITGRYFKPRYNHRISKGINSIGAPSVVMFQTNTEIRFQEKMVYMFDCEWYLQMRHKIGKPSILKNPLITIGIHSNQATHWAKDELKSEVAFTKKMHPGMAFRNKCSNCKKAVRS